MYRNMSQPAGFYGPQSSIYPQINTPITNPSMFAQTAPKVLPGRMINKLEDITVGDVPNDGSLGLFPQQDGSCIYAKSWNADGTIKTMKFIPSEETDTLPRKESVQEAESSTDPFSSIGEKLDLLLDLLTDPGSSKSKSGVKKNNQNGSEKEDKE